MTMVRQVQKAKQHQHEVLVDRNQHVGYQYTLTGATRHLTPMERWESEKVVDQPWNALAAFKANSGYRECFRDQAKSSTKQQNGSVDEEKKWGSVRCPTGEEVCRCTCRRRGCGYQLVVASREPIDVLYKNICIVTTSLLHLLSKAFLFHLIH